MTTPLPRRPRLADVAMARRHVVGTDEQLVMHDLRAQRMVRMELRHWDTLSKADGTRTIEEIARDPEARSLIEQLHAIDLIEDGPAPDIVLPSPTPASRPLEPLPEFALRCDRSGRCCGQYGTIGFQDEDVAAASAHPAHAPVEAHRFLPMHGSVARNRWAVTLVDGRCAFLALDGDCSIHEVKPIACRMHPATFVDDGETVRVSVGVECACVLASLEPGEEPGVPLITDKMTMRIDVDPSITIRVLPEQVPIAAGVVAPPAAIASWSRHVLGLLAPDADGPTFYLSVARALMPGGTQDPIGWSDVAPWIEGIARVAEDGAESAAQWRSPKDRTRIGRRILADAARKALERGEDLLLRGAPDETTARDERFHVRATLFGHHLAGLGPLVDLLRDRAARLLVARMIDAESHPIALVDAMMRGLGAL